MLQIKFYNNLYYGIFSPEVATRSAHGLEADIWGLGCLLYTMLVGIPPFDTSGVKSTLTKVVMSDYTLPENLSYEAKDLINVMLRKNPMERIKLQVIFNILPTVIITENAKKIK